MLCGQVGDVREPNLQKDLSHTRCARATERTEKEKQNFLCLRQAKISSFTPFSYNAVSFLNTKEKLCGTLWL